MTRAPGEPALLPPRPSWLPPDPELARFFAPTVRYVHYRIRVADYLARLLPDAGTCSILDVGAGDGYLGALFEENRPATTVTGVEVEPRRISHERAGLVLYDGLRLPFGDAAFDCVLLTNVLHHASDMTRVLAEACRVARRAVLIKDHLSRGWWDRWRLATLDVLGNLRFGASVAGDYLDEGRWAKLFADAGCGRVFRFEELVFRRGLMAVLFDNRLEIMFRVEPPPRSEAGALRMPSTGPSA